MFCNHELHKNLSSELKETKIHWILRPQHRNFKEFFSLQKKQLQSCEILLVTTISNHFSEFCQLPKLTITIFLIHNVHSFLVPFRSLRIRPEQRLRDILRATKFLFTAQWFYQKRLLKQSCILAFPNETVLNYVNSNFNLPSNITTIALPFSYFEERKHKTRNYITITIPCTIVSDIRDYQLVFKAFQILLKNLETSIELVLLGNPKGDGYQIVEEFTNLNHPLFRLVKYEKNLPFYRYKSQLIKSDFLILPIKQYGQNNIFKEKMGFSKISGSLNDMIRFGIPSLISATYPLSKELQILTETFRSSEDLADKIKYWIEEKTYLQKRKQISACLDKYRKDQMALDFKTKIQGLLSHKP